MLTEEKKMERKDENGSRQKRKGEEQGGRARTEEEQMEMKAKNGSRQKRKGGEKGGKML